MRVITVGIGWNLLAIVLLAGLAAIYMYMKLAYCSFAKGVPVAQW